MHSDRDVGMCVRHSIVRGSDWRWKDVSTRCVRPRRDGDGSFNDADMARYCHSEGDLSQE
jgi:hypothetical protein